jgi:hypothetical protein
MLLHREDIQPFDAHGKEGVDMIVQMDTVECENAGSDSLLAARTHPHISTAIPNKACTVSQPRRPALGTEFRNKQRRDEQPGK